MIRTARFQPAPALLMVVPERSAPTAAIVTTRNQMQLSIIGGGPAGLRAAEIASAAGAFVTLFDAQPSVGRKFLIAGRGGLNLTNTEPREQFANRYIGPPEGREFWRALLAEFDAKALCAWAAGLGIDTFAASTGRVYPRELKAAPLLRRWVQRLRDQGVKFAVRHRLTGIEPGPPLRLGFEVEGRQVRIETDAAILALGGGSWPQTGSDGAWTKILARLGVAITPLAPANCGWEISWPAELLSRIEGQPLKNIVVRAGIAEAPGELLVTSYGLEGGALYQLTPALRAMTSPQISIDFKPSSTVEQLVKKMTSVRRDFLTEACHRWRLSAPASAILETFASPTLLNTAQSLAEAVKHCTLPLTGPRPLAESISTAGGICGSELNGDLMLRRYPGIFIAGEMIDWEAPTGGYLLHGCLATGAHAARGALGGIQKVRREHFLTAWDAHE